MIEQITPNDTEPNQTATMTDTKNKQRMKGNRKATNRTHAKETGSSDRYKSSQKKWIKRMGILNVKVEKILKKSDRLIVEATKGKNAPTNSGYC